MYPRYTAYAIANPIPADLGIIPDLKNAIRTTAKPKQIRRLVRDVNRIPAERNTTYKILRTFENEPNDEDLDNVDDSKFGSYFDLIKIKKFRYENPR